MKHMAKVDLSVPITMSSLEIAGVAGKAHKNVLADIKHMLEVLEVHSAEFSAQYKDSTGRTLPCFNLPKRETLILMSGYSITMRAKIIDRWQALEDERQEEKQRVESRLHARLQNPAMTAALKHSRELIGKETKDFHFLNENNLIYRIAFGQSCKEFKLSRGLRDDDSMRDVLSASEIAMVDKLQQANTILISMGMGYEERKERLTVLLSMRIQHKEAA